MDLPKIIIDNGSGFCKAGISNNGIEPSVIIPSVVGHQKVSGIESIDSKCLFGYEALSNSQNLHLSRPVQRGIITDWNDMCLFWENLFVNELKVDIKQYGILMPEAPLTPKFHREKLTEIFFEQFEIPNIYITNSAVLALNAMGKCSGIVVDSGYEVTNFVPISSSYPYTDTIQRLNLGGKDITDYFRGLLVQSKHGNGDIGIDNANMLKEKFCFVSPNPEKEQVKEMSYELPDHTIVKMGEECHNATELFFHPEYYGKELGGIARKLCDVIYSTDHLTKKEIEGDIVLTGGNTMFSGFAERYSNELMQVANGLFKNRVKVTAIDERKYATWIGASVASQLNIYSSLQTTKKDYDEYGGSVVHSKCFY